MTDSICGATKRDGSGDACEQPAGWGTDHVGEGRCKLHGGCAGAPAGNQNAARHALNSDPDHYYQSLSPEQKEWVDKVTDTIRDRIRENSGEIDHVDLVLSHQVAIEIHIVSRAENYIANESGLMQEFGTRTEAVPLLEEVRLYGRSIMQNLKKLGVLDYPVSQGEVDTLDEWREFIESGNEISDPR